MIRQDGQIAIFAAIFLVLAGMTLFLTSTPAPPSNSLNTSKTPDMSANGCQMVDNPAVKFSNIARETKPGDKGAFIEPGNAEYKLIRRNVPIEVKTFFSDRQHSDKKGTQVVDGVTYDLYYPKGSGEVKLSADWFSPSRNAPRDLLYFIDWGLVFLVHLNNSESVSVSNGGKDYYITDIYQNVSKAKIPDEGFKCGATGDIAALGAGTSVVFPRQNTSLDEKQLQLQYFTFGDPVSGFVSDVQCKPAIYLYPKEKLMVNVRLAPKGILTYTDPPYPDGGWNVLAYPDGKLESRTDNLQLTTYNYLYYESKIRDSEIKKPEEGYVVSFEQLPDLYYKVLPKLGLNARQTQDFVDYWTKALPYSPYYFVGVMDQENVNNFEPLEIAPKPDFVNRVRIYFERLDKPITVEEPDLVIRHKIQDTRYKFKVVEWGGMVKMDTDHPFTCSQ